MYGDFSIDRLRARISESGVAHACRFRAFIVPPVQMGGRDRATTLLCETAPLMGRHFNTGTYEIFGPQVEYPYQTQFIEANFTFLCTGDMPERQFFDEWQNLISDTEEDHNTIAYPDDCVGTVCVFTYREDGAPTYGQEYQRAWPKQISDQELSAGATDYLRLAVSFAYRKWVPYTGVGSMESSGGLENAVKK